MSKKSCEAAESVEDAVLRMARVNSNNFSVMPYCSIEKLSTSTMYPGICQNRIHVRSRRRQMIAPLVFRVPGMSFYPGKMQLMGLCRRQKPLPEIDVFNRAGSALPVLFQPAVNPFFVSASRPAITAISSIRLLVVRI